MITERDFLERARLDRRTLTVWIEEEWLIPARTADELSFTDMDLARANLIRDLKDNMGVEQRGPRSDPAPLGSDACAPTGARGYARIRARSTAFIGLITSLWSSRAARGGSDLRAHLPIEVLGVENMVVQVGDPLAP